MALNELFGCIFLAFSFPLAVFWLTIRKSAKLVVIVVCGAFVWLLSVATTSIIWNILLPIKNDLWVVILYSVPIQELFRYLFWRLLKKAENGLNILASDDAGPITREKLALASGLGMGMMSAVSNFTLVLDSATGPGTLPTPGCSGVSFFAVSAVITGCLAMAHVFWTIVAYSGFEQRHARGGKFGANDWKFFYVLLSHYFFAYITLNGEDGNSCSATLAIVFVVTLFTGVLSWYCAGMTFASNKNS